MRWQYGQRAATVDRSADRQALRDAGFDDDQIAQMLPVAPDDASAADDAIELLEEDFPVWQLWCSLRTQWRVGMAGATGLDYTVLTPDYYRLFGINKPRARQLAFDKLRQMEDAALEIMNKKD